MQEAYQHDWTTIQGQASDINLVAKHIIQTKKRLNTILSKVTGQPLTKINHDCDRDYYLLTKKAIKYGIIDKIYE